MVWIASPSGCRLGDLASLGATPAPEAKMIIEERLEELMDCLVWCFCPTGDNIQGTEMSLVEACVSCCL